MPLQTCQCGHSRSAHFGFPEEAPIAFPCKYILVNGYGLTSMCSCNDYTSMLSGNPIRKMISDIGYRVKYGWKYDR